MTEPDFIAAERRAFEAWIKTQGEWHDQRLDRQPQGCEWDYVWDWVQSTWEGWLARAREVTVTEDLLARARGIIAYQLECLIDSYRYGDQTDEQVLADDDHDEIDDESYVEMNEWHQLLAEIDALRPGEG